MNNQHAQLPDLSDLIMYETEFDQDALIDVGDTVTIQCLDGIYRTGDVYAYGKTYVRIIDRHNHVHTALVTAEVELVMQLSYNKMLQEMYYVAKEV